MSDKVMKATDADFEETVVKSDVPVLVDFWASWCRPCLMVGPIIEEIADEYSGRAKVVKVDVDESKQVAGSMGINSIPTIALFQGGEVKELLVGVRSKADYTALLDKALNG